MEPSTHSLHEKVDKLYKDIYFGSSMRDLSVITRLTMTEDKIERVSKNLNKALWLAVSTLFLLICEIVLKLVKV